MTGPKTLLEMSGAPLTPSALSQSVVVSIDCQNEYVNGALALPGDSLRLKLPLHVVWARDVRDPTRDAVVETLLSLVDRYAGKA